MPAYRYPVLVWQDFEGCVTARIVDEWFPLAAVAPSVNDALYQLKDYVAWEHKQNVWLPEPDFYDARLFEFKVSLRPEYRVKERIFPADQSIAVKIACVHGRQQSGLLVGALPMLSIFFYYYEAKSLRELCTHYVQERLKGFTPQHLSRYLPPRSVALEEIVFNLNRKLRPAMHAPKLAALNAVAEPLGERSVRKQFARAWERDAEVADLVQRLTKEKANVLIVGEPGVGKTSVIVEAARQIERQTEAPTDKEEDEAQTVKHRFWSTSGARLIAGMQYLGQWEERVEKVIDELSSINGVLCCENLLDLVQLGGRAATDSIAAFLLPYLQRSELRMVAEATPSELEACHRLLPGLADVFQILILAPFTRDKAILVLNRVASTLASNRRVQIADGVTHQVYRLFNRFAPYHAFPGKTVAFLTEMFDRAEIERESVARERALLQFIRHTGLPELFLRDEMTLNQYDVIDDLKRQVIGQEEACRAAASLITTFKAGLNDPARPIGVMLFCGPTGVGKTEMARQIARFFFSHGDEKDRLTRLDMSEYSGPRAAYRMVSGVRGEPSELIKKMRQQPFAVVLFDEIEKAAPEVFDVLLSVFDEGRLTDPFGRVTTFRSAVIIMTSNLGADKLEAAGFDRSSARTYTAEAMSFFRPEFFNRIDQIVSFHSLDRASITAITEKELKAVSEREGLAKAGIRLVWTERARELLSRDGFDPRYGARPLQRTIETALVAPLARYLIERPGLRDSQIVADVGGDGKVSFALGPAAR